jgi:SAM-dependent methyltransferase
MSESEHVSDPIARARALSGLDDTAALYRDWAATYDADVFDAMGFTGSARIADLLASVLPDRTEPVLDLGCGTGAVGMRLAELGVTTIDGVDLSPEMLAIAASTHVYRHLAVADLNALPGRFSAPYAAAVSAGTFTTGHVGPAAVPHLLGLVRQGGIIAWVVGAGVWPLFEPVLASNGLQVVHQALEPIRRDGPPEAVMLVAVLGATTPRD